MNVKSHLLRLICLVLPIAATAQTLSLSLDSCHCLTLRNNKRMHMATVDVAQARLEQQSARTLYLPRVNAMGGYMRSGRDLQLLDDTQLQSLGQLGSNAAALLQRLATEYPELAQTLAGRQALAQSLVTPLNDVGQSLAHTLTPDTRNMGLLALTLTQPLYMGGKIRAANRIRDHALDISKMRKELLAEDLMVEVDETYWNIVCLQEKLQLARSYLRLVESLCHDVEKLQQEGFSTQADLLSVRVKVNEARVTVIQVENGLAIARMALCQLCGLPLDSDIMPDENPGDAPSSLPQAQDAIQTALHRRLELRLLNVSTLINQEKEKVTRADYLPHLALVGGYGATTPSLYKGFSHRIRGDWHAGVTLTAPLYTAGERRHKTLASHNETVRSQLQHDEAAEKIELQVTRALQLCREAEQRLLVAGKSQDEAEENLRCSEQGFKEGVIAVSDLLAAQTAWLKAHSTHVEALTDCRLAHTHLNTAMGNYKHVDI